jgi:hypothetical protein
MFLNSFLLNRLDEQQDLQDPQGSFYKFKKNNKNSLKPFWSRTYKLVGAVDIFVCLECNLRCEKKFDIDNVINYCPKSKK